MTESAEAVSVPLKGDKHGVNRAILKTTKGPRCLGALRTTCRMEIAITKYTVRVLKLKMRKTKTVNLIQPTNDYACM